MCARARCRPSVESPACASCHGIPCRHGIATPLCHNRARWDAQADGTCHATVREGDRDGDVRVDARDGLDDADRDGSCTTCTEQAAYIQHATCSTQHAARSMQHAACNMQLATCSVQHAACNMQHAACNMQHATCSVQHAACNMQRATCNMQRTTGQDGSCGAGISLGRVSHHSMVSHAFA